METNSTFISPDIEFHGEIRFDGSLEILGSVTGNIESKGALQIRSGALVKADISVGSISVEGTFQGNMNQVRFVHIAPTGKVNADIQCKEIQIDKKARFNGVLSM